MFLIWDAICQEWYGPKSSHSPRQLNDSVWFDFTGVTMFQTREEAEKFKTELETIDKNNGQKSDLKVDEFHIHQRTVGCLVTEKMEEVKSKTKGKKNVK